MIVMTASSTQLRHYPIVSIGIKTVEKANVKIHNILVDQNMLVYYYQEIKELIPKSIYEISKIYTYNEFNHLCKFESSKDAESKLI